MFVKAISAAFRIGEVGNVGGGVAVFGIAEVGLFVGKMGFCLGSGPLSSVYYDELGAEVVYAQDGSDNGSLRGGAYRSQGHAHSHSEPHG